MLAGFVFAEHQDEATVVAPCKGWSREVTSPPFFEALGVFVFELDSVVLAARSAPEAVELYLAGRPFVHRVAHDALSYDPVAVV
jgi:hypothetical protein